MSLSKGHKEAQRLYALGPCERCKAPGVERHHKDGNPGNNVATNVEVLCRKCHLRSDGRAYSNLTDIDILVIRYAVADNRASQRMLAKQYGVTNQAISDIVLGKTWKLVGGPRRISQTLSEEQHVRMLYAHATYPNWSIRDIAAYSRMKEDRVRRLLARLYQE
jgi:hypothetical protein